MKVGSRGKSHHRLKAVISLTALFIALFAAARVFSPGSSLPSFWAFLPNLTNTYPPNPLTLNGAWTTDSAGNPRTGFGGGELVRYYGSGESSADQPVEADLSWSVNGLCGETLIYSETALIDPGAWTAVITQTVPACSGELVYSFEAAFRERPLVTSTVFTVTNPVAVTVRMQAAFDKCDNPSLSQMAAWWTGSPYQVANIYIGGSMRACDNLDLTPGWVTTVLSQGWGLIPTWVGPQAPCSVYSDKMSGDPAVSYLEGRAEADAAAVAAASLGLTSYGSGSTIIYYDMEGYPGGSNPSCRAAVRSFVNGWVERMHELGNRAGVYGGACSSYISEWATIPNVPDDVWIAAWYTPYYYDPNATVWDVPCVAGNLWDNHERIRQYTGGHNETWGGVSMNIDCDVTDGEVLTYPQAPPRWAAPPSLAVEPILQDFGALWAGTNQPGSAWALNGGGLRWTVDGGQSWGDFLHPEGYSGGESDGSQQSAGHIAFFLDAERGWLVSNHSPEEPRFRIWQTSDGGQSWQVYPLAPVNEELIGARPVSLEFISLQEGWLVLRLASSSNFNLGALFHTVDGGRSWQRLPIPAGEAARFVSAQEGWALGGVEGDELYRSRDGGSSWEQQTILSPGEPFEYIIFSLPVFQDGLHGILPVTIVETDSSGGAGWLHQEFYRTQDGGDTWRLVSTLVLAGDDSSYRPHLPDTAIPVEIVSQLVWVVADPSSGAFYLTHDGGQTWQQTAHQSTLLGVVELAFDSPDTGWALTRTGSCANEQGCTLGTALWRTQDGGWSWTPVVIEP